MSRRMPDLLRKAAAALGEGVDPFSERFFDAHDLTLDECLDLGALMAAGAQVMAWAMDNPKTAAAAFQGAQMQTLVTLMEHAGRGERR